MAAFGIMHDEQRVTQEIGIHIEVPNQEEEKIKDLISEKEEVFNRLAEMLIQFNKMILDRKTAIPTVEEHIKKMVALAPTENLKLRIVAGTYKMINDRFGYKKIWYAVKQNKPRVVDTEKQKKLQNFYRRRIYQAMADGLDLTNRVEWISLCCEAKYYGIVDEEIKRIIMIAKKRYKWN